MMNKRDVTRGVRGVCLAVALLVFAVTVHAAFALALLVEPAADFVGGLVLRSLARQAVVTVGVAANDASWIASTATLASRAVAILKIAGFAFDYEIPTLPDTPVPKPATPKPASGEPGTYNNPYPYTQAGFKPRVVSAQLCNVPAYASSDGLAHSIAVKTYDTLAEIAAACDAVQSYKSVLTGYQSAHWITSDAGGEISALYPPAQVLVGGVYLYVRPIALTWGFPESGNLSGFSLLAGESSPYLAWAYAEAADSVKRFIRTAEGFKPDTTDPDWTAEEKAAFNTARAIQFRSAESVVNVSATATQTAIQAATQVATDVRYRDVVLNAEAVPVSTSEQLVKSASAGDVLASETSTGSGTAIEFPSDYARQGEAATAAAAVTNKLDTLHDDLTKAGETPADLIAPDASTFEDSFFKGAFADLLEWNLPAHTSTCPTAAINFDFFGQPFNVNMNAQCLILADETVSSTAQTAFVVLWILVALFIVLGA